MSDYTAVPEMSAAAGKCICGHPKHSHWITKSAIEANGGFSCVGSERPDTPRSCKCGGYVPKVEPTVAVHPVVQLVQQQAIIDSLRHFIQGLMAGQALAAQVVAEEGGNYWVKAYKLFAKSQEKKHGANVCTCLSHQFAQCRGQGTLGAGWLCARELEAKQKHV